jgi:SAM-dependent methyltransferase
MERQVSEQREKLGRAHQSLPKLTISTGVTRGNGLLENFLAQQRIKIAQRLIPPAHRNGRLLDIGCGSYPLWLVSSTFSDKYGLDKVVTSEQIALFQGQNINLQSYDNVSERLPFEDEYFSVVTMLAVFEHIEPSALHYLLSEIRRVLQPGGVYILTTPAVWADKLLRLLAKLHIVSPVEIEDHKDTYTHGKVKRLLKKAGFKDSQLACGYFEFYLNLWVTATK